MNCREIRRYPELKNNKNTTYQNLLDVAKSVLTEKCLALNPYVHGGGAQNQLSEILPLEARKRNKLNQKKWSNESRLWAVLHTRIHLVMSRDIFG